MVASVTHADASNIEDASERAWAHRRLIDSLLAGEQLALSADVEARTLFDFSDPLEAPRWRVVVDGVMGGLSTGRLAQEGDTMVFTGRTSLRNNGGFSSIRVPIRAGSVAGYDALRIRVCVAHEHIGFVALVGGEGCRHRLRGASLQMEGQCSVRE